MNTFRITTDAEPVRLADTPRVVAAIKARGISLTVPTRTSTSV